MSEKNREAHINLRRLQKLYKKKPDSKIFSSLAAAYRECGMLTEAIQTALEGLTYDPACTSAKVVLAQCYLDRGDISRATTELEKIVDCSPDNLLAQRLLISCYEKKGAHQKELAATKTVLQEYPHDPDLNNCHTELEKKVGPLDKPLSSNKDISPSSPPSPEEIEGFQMCSVEDIFEEKKYETTALGDIYEKQGHFDKALSVYEKVFENEPSDENLRKKITHLRNAISKGQLIEKERWERAFKRLERDPSKAKQINLLSDMLSKIQEANDGA
ncbi:tetratricopeptide repeat protein [Bdellovibrionota bacterium]